MAESTDAYPKYLDWSRYLSAFLLFTYGSSKLLGRQFTLPPELALRPVGSLSGYQLAWFYYSYSHVYAVILGLIQLGAGALLLFRKTALLGAALTLPVMANILMINVFFFIAWGGLNPQKVEPQRPGGSGAALLSDLMLQLGSLTCTIYFSEHWKLTR